MDQRIITPTTSSIQQSPTNNNSSDIKTVEQALQLVRQNPTWTEEEISKRVGHLIEYEFPDEEKFPRARDVDHSVYFIPSDNGPCWYGVGQWIERYHDDMAWHLEPIRRIVKSEDVNDETGEIKVTYYYKTSAGVLVRHDLVRAPEEGLKRAFGYRPWIWQQWALLKLEENLRFQKQHQRDFQEVDFVVLPTKLWDKWLHDPLNADFKNLHDSKPESAQIKLKDHIFKCFQHMNDVVEENPDWWPELKDSRASVYQYCSVFGSGFFTAWALIFVQITVPILLLVFQVRTSSRFTNYPVESGTEDWVTIFETNTETFCNDTVALDALIMNFVVFIVYVIRVVPIVYDTVYCTLGDQPTVASRLNSIRQGVWDQADDTIWMQFGFKLDRYMNSVYVVLTNLLMLIVIFLTDSTVDVILNALAVEFVIVFDFEVTESIWYDKDRRYLMAGIIEQIFRVELRLEWLETSWSFAENLYVPDYKNKVGGPMYDEHLARSDRVNPEFLSSEDRLWQGSLYYVVTHKMNSYEAKWQYAEEFIQFGFGDLILQTFGLKDNGIFNRYRKYYSWSRWKIALFASPVHDIAPLKEENGKLTCDIHCQAPILASVRNEKSSEQVSSSNSRVMTSTTSHLKHMMTSSSKIPLLNYDPASSWSPNFRFMRSLTRMMTFQTGIQSINTVVRRRNYIQLLFRTPDAVVEVLAIWLTCMFPIGLGCIAVLIFACQPIA
jgi:hypothetical protein